MKKIGNLPITEADTDFSKISTKNYFSERFQEVLQIMFCCKFLSHLLFLKMVNGNVVRIENSSRARLFTINMQMNFVP